MISEFNDCSVRNEWGEGKCNDCIGCNDCCECNYCTEYND
jgi:hypothetical protein